MTDLSSLEQSSGVQGQQRGSSRAIRQETHEIKLSMEVSIGFVFSDLRNDAKPGVNASDVEGILYVVL